MADFAAWVRTQHAAAQARCQRRCLCLAGDYAWGRDSAAQIARLTASQPLWLGHNPPAAIPALAPEQARQALGCEYDTLVFDAWQDFQPDAFGAVSGSLRGGGLLCLLVPPRCAWSAVADPARPSRFLQRLSRLLQQADEVIHIAQHLPLPAAPAHDALPSEAAPPASTDACATADQAAAVEAIMRAARGRARRPLLLTSDRGRGKSAALGLAAARLLSDGPWHIRVTAPRPAAVNPVFMHAAQQLPAAHRLRLQLQLAEARLEFTPPDALYLDAPPADLLLVDEAAALPTTVLARLLTHYPRIIFATTRHGYEGTGGGFSLRFQPLLEQQTPQWQALELHTPIRWAKDDPLEALTWRLLLLDSEPAPVEAFAVPSPAACELVAEDRTAWLCDEARLRELFGLLLLAHPRTTPGDLQRLLDDPALRVFTLTAQGHILAAVLLATEGGFDPAMSRAIHAGYRRPRGHLVPQSLAFHAGLVQAPAQQCARIMRIAVHPRLQGQGYGTRLLQRLHTTGLAHDYFAASFGAEPRLLRFWQRAGYYPVRIGTSRGTSSGLHAVIVMRAHREPGDVLLQQARNRLLQQLPTLLSEPLRELEADLVDRLLEPRMQPRTPVLEPLDWGDVVGFAFAQRPFEVCQPALLAFFSQALSDPRLPTALADETRQLLIIKLLQRHTWQTTAKRIGLTGRAAVLEQLRLAIQALVRQVAPPDIQAQIPTTDLATRCD